MQRQETLEFRGARGKQPGRRAAARQSDEAAIEQVGEGDLLQLQRIDVARDRGEPVAAVGPAPQAGSVAASTMTAISTAALS